MKLRELRHVAHPMQNVKIIYRDPTHSLQTSIIYEGVFKFCVDPIILDRSVAVFKTLCSDLYVEIY